MQTSNIVSSARPLNVGPDPAFGDQIAHAAKSQSPVGDAHFAAAQAGTALSTTSVWEKFPPEVWALMYQYLPDTDRMHFAMARPFNTLQFLSGRQRVEFLVALFGGDKERLKCALSCVDEALGSHVKEFTQTVLSVMENGTAMSGTDDELIAHLKAAGLSHPRMFLVSAVLSVLPRLHHYPVDLALDCLTHLNSSLAILERDFTGDTNSPNYELHKLLINHPALKNNNKNIRLQMLDAVVQTLPRLKDAAQERAYEVLEAGILHSSIAQNVKRGIFTSFLKTMHNGSGNVQGRACQLFRNRQYLHTLEIAQALIQAMPCLPANQQIDSYNALEGVLTAAWTLIDVKRDASIFLLSHLPGLNQEIQMKALELINREQILHTPEVLKALVTILPKLHSPKHSDGNDMQGKAYSVLRNTLDLGMGNSSSMEARIDVIVEMANVHRDLSQHPRPAEKYLARYRNQIIRILPTSTFPILLNLLCGEPIDTAIGAGGVAVAGEGRAIEKRQRSIQKAVEYQMAKIVEKLGRENVLAAISQEDMLRKMAPAWTTLASEAYPRLTDNRKRKMKNTIETLCASWKDTMLAQQDNEKKRAIFTAMAPFWTAVLTHVFPGVSKTVDSRVSHISRIRTEIVDEYERLQISIAPN